MKKIIPLALTWFMSLMLIFSLNSWGQSIITQWDFEGDVIVPSIGEGTANLIGGATATFATGVSGGRGWNTTTYPAQGTLSGTAGVEFMVSTEGYSDIKLSFSHRSSGTGSRWAEIHYTTDGGTNWIVLGNNEGGLSPHDTFYLFEFDFSSDEEANDNPDFGVRIVSIFSPLAFDQNGSVSFGADEAYQRSNSDSGPVGEGTGTGDYGTGGTWRFDDVALSGTMPDYTTLFQYSALAGNLPTWLNADAERGFTVSGDNVYVASRNDGQAQPASVGTRIHILDRLTGAELTGSPVEITGLTAGAQTFAINDIEATEDGVLMVANLAIGNAHFFRVYSLAENGVGTKVLEFQLPENGGRLGDKFTVVGSLDDRSAVVYAADASFPRVFKWRLSPEKNGLLYGTPDIINIPVAIGGSPNVAPLPDGSFYYTNNAQRIHKINANGTLVGTTPEGVIIPNNTNGMKYLGKDGNDDMLAVYVFGVGQERMLLVRVLNGNPATIELEFETPSMRNVANGNGAGDIAFLPKPDGNVDVYVLATNNGLAGYTSNNLSITPPVYEPPVKPATIDPTEIIVYTNWENEDAVFTITWNDASEVTGMSAFDEETAQWFPLPGEMWEVTDDDGTTAKLTVFVSMSPAKDGGQLVGQNKARVEFDKGEPAEITANLIVKTFLLTFIVEDPDGNPVEDFMITLDPADGGNVFGNEDNVYEVEAGATYDYSVKALNYVTAEGEIEAVVEDATVTVVMTPFVSPNPTNFATNFAAGQPTGTWYSWAGGFTPTFDPVEEVMVVNYNKTEDPDNRWDRLTHWIGPFNLVPGPFYAIRLKSDVDRNISLTFKDADDVEIVKSLFVAGDNTFRNYFFDLSADLLTFTDPYDLKEIQYELGYGVMSGTLVFDEVRLGTSAIPSYARAQIIHNSADAAAGVVDVYVNGNLAVPNFEFRSATPFIDLIAGLEITIDVTPAGGGLGSSVGTFNVTLAEDETYVIVANGLLADVIEKEASLDFSLFPYAPAREAAQNPINTDVLVFHGSTDAPTVGVWAGGTEPVELFKFSYGEFQGYFELPTNTYVLEVRTEDGETVVASYVAPLGVLGLNGQAVTVLASGFLTPAEPGKADSSFGLFVATAAGGALVPLPLLEDVDSYTLTLLASPEAGGTVSGAGVYLPGELVEVVATPNEKYLFLNWTDDMGAVFSSSASNVIPMPAQDLTLTANFIEEADPLVLNTLLDKTGANLPAEIGTGGNARSAALYQNRYVIVASREGGPNVWVFDRVNPHLPPVALDYGDEIIEPLIFPINYVRTAGDAIYVSNLTLDPAGTGWAQGVFKIYRWNDLESGPEVVLSYNAQPGRLGDAFSIVGDPKTNGKIIAHINASKQFRVWNFEDGVLTNELTPDLITLDVPEANINNHGIYNPIEGEDDLFIVTSNNKGLMVADINGNVLTEWPTSIIDMRAYDPNIFFYDGRRFLSYTINNEGNAEVGAKYQIVDISIGENVIEAMEAINSSVALANRVVYSKSLGTGHPNLTAINQVSFDEDGEFLMFAHVVGKGFILETTGELPATYALTVNVEPAESGTTTGAGVYQEGATVPLTATPAAGFQFVNWTDADGEVSDVAQFNFTMPAEAVTLMANFEEIPLTEVATLAELRTLPADGTAYRYTGNAVIVAQNAFNNRKFIQDETAAILIYDPEGIITTDYNLYDVVTNIRGTINVWNSLVRFQPILNTPASTANTPVNPAVKAFAEVTSADQAKLIKFESVTFISTGNFANSQSYSISDGTNTFILRTDFQDVNYIGTAIPTGTVDISGVVYQFQEDLQIIPRFLADIYIPDSVEDLLGEGSVRMYPNPARDRIFINAASRINWVIISDITGKILINKQISDLEAQIPAEGLNSGMYIVRIYTEDGVAVRKLQIQR